MSSIYDFYEKKRDFLVDRAQKLLARGHWALPEHSVDIHIPDFKVLQPPLRHNFCAIVCFLIYRKMDDSGYDSPFLGKTQSRHMAASADESLEEDNKSLR